jgi:hypothetical protein|tara:strand:- start:197 stop:538 length:342 start_codon:yes stop_codon:yes gene_type:complete
MSRFGKYLGYLKIEIGQDKFDVKPNLRQKQRLLSLSQKLSKEKDSDETWSQMHSIFKEILRTADAEAKEEELDGFLMRHDMEFMMQLFQGFGWAEEGDLSSLKEKLGTSTPVN